jgi:hypothetical protein
VVAASVSHLEGKLSHLEGKLSHLEGKLSQVVAASVSLHWDVAHYDLGAAQPRAGLSFLSTNLH